MNALSERARLMNKYSVVSDLWGPALLLLDYSTLATPV